MNPELSQSQKLDILLKLSKEFNLKEVPNDPAAYTMSCGNGYTLFACVNRSWYFQFEDGITTETYDIESVKVPLTNAKDARKLSKQYNDECEKVALELKGVNSESSEPETVETEVVDDVEAKKKILEALENGDIRKPDQKPASGRIRTKRADTVYNEENSTAYNGSANIEPVNLPAPAGIGGIVRPAVSAAEALAAWREFQELKHAILSKSDVKKIQGKDFVVKSGWRKFATFYNLTDVIVDEQRQDLTNGEFLWKMKVVCTAPNGRKTEGVAICTSTEKKFSHPEHDVYTTCHTRAKNRAISDMIAAGEVSAEEMEA